jgi:glucosylceramidase
MVGNLNAGMNAWCDWNLVLDEKGGPNHVGNYCEAPVLVHRDKGSIEYKPSWFYIGHFSRFIKPGSVRIGCTRFSDGIECVAFGTPAGERVLVAMNRGNNAVGFTLRHADRVAPVEIPGHGIVTLLWGRE